MLLLQLISKPLLTGTKKPLAPLILSSSYLQDAQNLIPVNNANVSSV